MSSDLPYGEIERADLSVVDNAEAQYLVFFAGKTVGVIRAPDLLFPYFHLSEKNYAKLNRYVMSFIFFIPLTLIALYETTFDPAKHTWVDNWWRGDDEGGEDSPQNRDPAVDDAGCRGMDICRVQFEGLIKEFPNTTSFEATISKEIDELKTRLSLILQKLGD
ncbi:hypothetical protein P691DRAFT_759447 [Macrolepiota fuliginosa MF-IS2]|uniref:Uncharacterized protein n=1 Tax=Macrolepiota fuliginosa MF-IS2 TaxID=1400762 RepID=A0A9P5XCQ0_9AGAR|nr:hypothetical protein P691DRAFT_759447 [Macrolepiota fuliginosa MF-IS2]